MNQELASLQERYETRDASVQQAVAALEALSKLSLQYASIKALVEDVSSGLDALDDDRAEVLATLDIACDALKAKGSAVQLRSGRVAKELVIETIEEALRIRRNEASDGGPER